MKFKNKSSVIFCRLNEKISFLNWVLKYPLSNIDSTKNLVFVAVAWIIIFVIGLGAGFVLRSQTKTEIIKEQTINNLASKVISSVAVYGQITKVQGRDVTLNNLGDNLTITLADNAQIYAFKIAPAVKGSKTVSAPTQQKASLADLKIGDKINAVIKILDDGQLQGSSLVILPIAN